MQERVPARALRKAGAHEASKKKSHPPRAALVRAHVRSALLSALIIMAFLLAAALLPLLLILLILLPGASVLLPALLPSALSASGILLLLPGILRLTPALPDLPQQDTGRAPKLRCGAVALKRSDRTRVRSSPPTAGCDAGAHPSRMCLPRAYRLLSDHSYRQPPSCSHGFASSPCANPSVSTPTGYSTLASAM